MGRPGRSVKSATKRHRHGAFCPQVECLEQRQQPGDALISGWMTAALLGGAAVPVTVGPARSGGDTWAADSMAGQRRDVEAVAIVSQVPSPRAGVPDAAGIRTTAGGIFAEDPAAPVSFRQGQHATPTDANAAPAPVTDSAAARALSPGGFLGRQAVAPAHLPDALAGQAAAGGREHTSANVPAGTSQTIPLAQPAARAVSPTAPRRHPATGSAAPASFGQLPLTFEANRGQADSQVQFLAREPGYTLFLTGTEAVLALAPDPTTHEGNLLRLDLIGANPAAQAAGLDEQPGKVNYIHGNNPAGWQVNVPTFAQVRYSGIYPGIDLVYYSTQQQLEYDFRVAPGADPGAIRLAVTGPASPTVDAQGNLVLHTPGGDLVQHKPVIYQEGAGGREDVAGGFVVQGSQVRFAVGAYDPGRALIIDPVLSYSTYLGGNGDTYANAAKVDAAGNVYVAGSTTSTNFPTLNPYQSTYQGGTEDAFVSKLNPTGTALIYSTYLGGSGTDEADALAVDGNGNAYLTGVTGSTNFPVTAGVVQRTFGGGTEDVFVTKLNAGGNGLLYSTFLGGSDDESAAGIAVDAGGSAYLTGDTVSTDFPTTAGAFQRTMLGFDSAYVTKLNPGATALAYSTYLGADVNADDTGGDTYGTAIAVDASGNAYLTGETDSTGFPVTAGAFQQTLRGTNNAFVTKVNAGGTGLVYSAFLGGTGEDCGAGLAVDAGGNAYVVGTTDSVDFPTANAFQPTYRGTVSNAFVTKVNAAGSALVYSTYLGGTKEDYGAAIAVDAAGDAYATGTTDSGNFPILNAVQATKGGGFDTWLTKFSPAGSALVYSTFLGGTGDDGANAVAVDPSLNVYVAGQTTSTNYPTTPGAYQRTLGGTTNAVVSKVSDIHFRVTPSAGSVTAGTAFSVTVTALDAAENPAPGYRGTIHFTSSDGRATLPAAYTFTAADNGVHTFGNGVTLVTAGSQTLSVADGTLSGSTPVTVQAGPAQTLQLTGVPSSVTAGTLFSVTVTARDQYNNVATGYRGAVSFSSSDARAALPAAYTFTAADNGVHTFSNGVTLVTTGNQTVSLTDGTLSASAMITVQVGAATTLQLTGVPASTSAGAAFTVTVTARDPYNNVATGYRGTVSFRSSDARATLPAAYTFTAADAGVHTFSNAVTLITAGNQTVSLTDGTLSASAATTVQPGAAAALSLTGVPASTSAGAAFSVTVTALDQYNNVATAYQGTISFSSTDAGASLPADYTFTTADNGVHTFDASATLVTAGTQTLAVTDGTLTAGAAIAVQPGTAVTLQLSGVPSSVVAGTPFQVTVTALDAYNNVVTGYQGTVSFSSTDAGATLPAAYTFTAADGGVHTFGDAVTLVTAGGQALTAADDTLSTSVGVSVTPAPAVALVLSVPSSVTSGMAFDGTLTAVDPYGNTDVNYTGTVSFSSSDPDPGVVLPASYTFSAADQGSVFFPGGFTLITPGLQTISAADDTGIAGSASVTVTAGDSPNVAGRLHPRRGAPVDAGLLAAWPILRALPPAAGSMDHPTIAAGANEPVPQAGTAWRNARVDHYFTLPWWRSDATSDHRQLQDFPDLVPEILGEIPMSIGFPI